MRKKKVKRSYKKKVSIRGGGSRKEQDAIEE